jgi:FKBP-type peptidyl-prolyl cis-trans isomerase FklB
MKKILFVALSLAVLKAEAQKTKPAPVKKPAVTTPVLKNLTDSASYAMGVSMASFYAQQGVQNINPALVSQAIRDVYAKKNLAITDAQCNEIIMKLMDARQEEKLKPSIAAAEKFLEANKKRAGVKTTASGLQYEVITEGTGPRPTAADEVTVNYVGTLVDGTEVDNSYKRGQPISFNLGGVIKGWTEGLQLMPVGSKYKFYIPYELGYGLHGTGPIPGAATLIFEIELLSIKGK